MTKYSPEQNAQARFIAARLRAGLADIRKAIVVSTELGSIARHHLDDLAIALAAYDIVSEDGFRKSVDHRNPKRRHARST
jgi:hypothetical protein